VTVQPPDYDALVDQSTQEVEHSSGFRASLVALPVLGAIAGGIVGAQIGLATTTTHVAAGAAAGLVAGFVLPWIYVSFRARSVATQRFFTAWAEEHGLRYVADPPVLRDAPLLREGDKQLAARGFVGRLAGLDGMLYQHTKRVIESNGKTTTEQDTDYVVLHLGFSLPGFSLLELEPRSFGDIRMLDGIESKLTRHKVVELESEELGKAFKLDIDDGVDETRIRELFTPVVIEKVLSTQRDPAFDGGIALQLENGTLIFYRRGSLNPNTLPLAEALVTSATPWVAWLEAFAGTGTHA
jgi:hypothetical protein